MKIIIAYLSKASFIRAGIFFVTCHQELDVEEEHWSDRTEM